MARMSTAGRWRGIVVTAAWLVLAPALAYGASVGGAVDFETVDGQPLMVGPISGGAITFHNVQGSGVDVTFASSGLLIRNFHDEGIPGTNYPDTNVLSTPGDAGNIVVTFTLGFSADSASVVNLNSEAKLFAQEVDIINGMAFSSQNANQAPIDSAVGSNSPFTLDGPGIRMLIYGSIGTGYAIDSFTFTGTFDVLPVSLPSSMLLLGTSLALLAAGRCARPGP